MNKWNDIKVKEDLHKAIKEVIKKQGVIKVIDAFFGHNDLPKK